VPRWNKQQPATDARVLTTATTKEVATRLDLGGFVAAGKMLGRTCRGAMFAGPGQRLTDGHATFIAASGSKTVQIDRRQRSQETARVTGIYLGRGALPIFDRTLVLSREA